MWKRLWKLEYHNIRIYRKPSRVNFKEFPKITKKIIKYEWRKFDEDRKKSVVKKKSL